MNSGFPLFRLPQVALGVALKYLGPKELIFMSLCSKSAYRLAKIYRDKSRKLKIGVSLSRIYVEEGDENDPIFRLVPISERRKPFKTLKIGSETISYVIGREDEVCSYWTNLEHGTMLLAAYVTDFFDSTIHSLNLCFNDIDQKQMIDWVMNRQGTVAHCHREFSRDRRSNDEDLKYFLDNCIVDKEMGLYANPSEGFQHTFSVNTEKVIMQLSDWITPDNLFAMNCECIYLANTKFTSNDLNAFLRNWLNGAMQNLKCLLIDIPDAYDMAVATNGIGGIEVHRDEEINYDGNWYDEMEISDSFEIERGDGVHASVVIDSDYEFTFVVWPDLKGRQYGPN